MHNPIQKNKMGTNSENKITEEEIEILQEALNISFGKATSDLAEIVDIYVALSVPYVEVMPATELQRYIENEIKDYETIEMVKQQFWGKFKGIAFLIFSSGSGKKLVSLLQNETKGSIDSEIDALEKETLIEAGNILIGACVGKLADLLGDIVTYSPPVAIVHRNPKNSIPNDIFDSNSTAILLRTVFRFEKEDVTGFLFLTTSDDSITWLKKALKEFMDQYG